MRKILTRIFSCLFLFISLASYSQEASVYKWSYTSKKISERKYEIVFLTTGVQGWQLYAPNQELSGVKTVELSFADSSISFEKVLTDKGSSKTFVSPIFENTTVKVYEGQTEWTTSITINGLVPAEVQGKLTYFYGKDDEFTSDLPLSFHIPLEGGI